MSGFCVKEASGVEIDIDGSTARLAVWMEGPTEVDEDTDCPADCALVADRLELVAPLPTDVTSFEPIGDAVETCWPDSPPPPSTTPPTATD